MVFRGSGPSAIRVIRGAYLVLLVLLAALVFVPGIRSAATLALGVAAVGAACVGVVNSGRALRPAWLVLAASMLAQLVGLFVFVRDGARTGMPGRFPSAADDWLIAAMPLMIVAMALFVLPAIERRWLALVDAFIVAIALGLLLWLLFLADFHPVWTSWRSRSIAFVYILGYVAVLALSLLMSASDARRLRAGALFAAGTVSLYFGDFSTLARHGPPLPAGVGVYAGFGLCWFAWSAAMLDPGMAGHDATGRRAVVTPRVWTGMLASAALIGPVILFVQQVRGRLAYGPGLAAVALALFVGVSVRLAVALAEGRRTAASERALRRTAALLLSAGSIEDIAAGVTGAAVELTASRADADVVLAVIDRPPEPGATARWRVVGRHDGLNGDAVLPIPSDFLVDEVRPRALDAAPLVDAGVARARERQAVMLFPLAADSLRSASPPATASVFGALIASSSRRTMSTLRGPLGILADQAALAIDRLASQRELRRRESQAYFRTLVQNMSDVIFIAEIDGVIRYASPSAARMFGSAATPGRSIVDLAAESGTEVVRELLTALEREHPTRAGPVHARFATDRGSVVDTELRCDDLRGEPTVGALVFTLRDVTEQRRLLAQMERMAHQDPLTGLANRRLFLEAVDRALASAGEGPGPVGVMMLDIDDFKQVNDTWGHAAGDELIQQTARCIESAVRAGDTVARLGGDEFAVLVLSAHTVEGLESIAERVIRTFRAPLAIGTGPVSSSVSVGLAVASAPFRTHELLREADVALYAAKGAGKRQWRRYGRE